MQQGVRIKIYQFYLLPSILSQGEFCSKGILISHDEDAILSQALSEKKPLDRGRDQIASYCVGASVDVRPSRIVDSTHYCNVFHYMGHDDTSRGGVAVNGMTNLPSVALANTNLTT